VCAAAAAAAERNAGGARAELQVSNPTEAHVLFKVKTNAAKRYAVKPHVGVLAPHEGRSVSSECPAVPRCCD
jgi:P pilus assembly chaperone PapD